MKFHKCQLSIEIPLPGGNPGVATSTGSFFTHDKGFDVDYDPATQLVTISKDGERRVVHVSKVNSFDPFRDEDVKPKAVKKAV